MRDALGAHAPHEHCTADEACRCAAHLAEARYTIIARDRQRWLGHGEPEDADDVEMGAQWLGILVRVVGVAVLLAPWMVIVALWWWLR